MTKTEIIVAKLRFAGYHGDTRRFTQIIIENHIRDLRKAQQAYDEGIRAKENGIGCKCFECRVKEEAKP